MRQTIEVKVVITKEDAIKALKKFHLTVWLLPFLREERVKSKIIVSSESNLIINTIRKRGNLDETDEGVGIISFSLAIDDSAVLINSSGNNIFHEIFSNDEFKVEFTDQHKFYYDSLDEDKIIERIYPFISQAHRNVKFMTYCIHFSLDDEHLFDNKELGLQHIGKALCEKKINIQQAEILKEMILAIPEAEGRLLYVYYPS